MPRDALNIGRPTGPRRPWPRRSGAGQQSSPSRPTTASAAACPQPEADWHQGHVRSTLEMHHVCMAGRTIPKPPITPRRLSRVPAARSSALTVTKAAAKYARTRCTLADEASVRYNRHHAAATQGCMTAMDCNGDIAMRRERAFDRSPCPRVCNVAGDLRKLGPISGISPAGNFPTWGPLRTIE